MDVPIRWLGERTGDSLFLAAFFRRAAAFWLLLHLLLFTISLGAIRFLPLRGALFAAIVSGWIGMLDVRRRRETLFLANLGVQRWMPAACWALTIVLLESLGAAAMHFAMQIP
jgi:hypothetical protein